MRGTEKKPAAAEHILALSIAQNFLNLGDALLVPEARGRGGPTDEAGI